MMEKTLFMTETKYCEDHCAVFKKKKVENH